MSHSPAEIQHNPITIWSLRCSCLLGWVCLLIAICSHIARHHHTARAGLPASQIQSAAYMDLPRRDWFWVFPKYILGDLTTSAHTTSGCRDYFESYCMHCTHIEAVGWDKECSWSNVKQIIEIKLMILPLVHLIRFLELILDGYRANKNIERDC